MTGLGQSYLGQHKPTAARPQLERAVRMREASDPDPGRLGEARFALARALWPDVEARPRAQRLADQARADYRRQPGGRPKADEIGAWLVRHSAGAADL